MYNILKLYFEEIILGNVDLREVIIIDRVGSK